MPSKWIPLADLNGTNGDPAPEWIRLSDVQRRLVTAYIGSNYSKTEAVRAVYNCAEGQSERTTINRSFGNQLVTFFLATHMGQTPQDAFREELQKIAASPKSISATRLQVLKMLAKQVGADTSALNEIDSLSDGKVVAQKEFEKDGKKYKTTVTEIGDAQ